MTTLLQNPDLRVLSVLTGLAGHYGKTYVIPAQDTICRLLRRHTGRVMSRRTLNRHLAALQAQGYIQRKRRHKRGRSGALELHSTLYQLTRRALALAHRTAHALGRICGQVAQVVDYYAVTKPAQYLHTPVKSSSPAATSRPPPEIKNLLERPRRANSRSTPPR